jgi:negative regulator of flagellin synthesis FlgM
MVDTNGVKGAANDRAVARVLEVRAATPTPPPSSPPQHAAPDIARLSGVAAELAAKPPVDSDRVHQIKRAIANGTFPILPATVADRLLAVRYEWLYRDQA